MADLVVSSIAPIELRRQLLYSIAIGEMPRITKIQLLWPVSGPKPSFMEVAAVVSDLPRDHCTGARGFRETAREAGFMSQFTNDLGEVILDGEVIAVQDEMVSVLSGGGVKVVVFLRDVVTGLLWQ